MPKSKSRLSLRRATPAGQDILDNTAKPRRDIVARTVKIDAAQVRRRGGIGQGGFRSANDRQSAG